MDPKKFRTILFKGRLIIPYNFSVNVLFKKDLTDEANCLSIMKFLETISELIDRCRLNIRLIRFIVRELNIQIMCNRE